MKKLLILFVLLCTVWLSAQTNPGTPLTLPVSQDFSGLAWTATALPTGWSGWKVGTAATTSFNLGFSSGSA
ncbi:MAG: hypothetical protein LWX56_03430, partial [Ignavibacteria bacterium]|nr:hypothetical protein [Ignavibacteria bacterium]